MPHSRWRNPAASWASSSIQGTGIAAPATDNRAEASTPDAPAQKRQFDQLVDYTQKLLPAAKQRREEFFWSKLDTSSLEKFKKSQEPLRDYFWNEIIGKLPEPTMPLNPRTRLLYETPKWKGYEVVLDVYEDVISYGILLVPNDIKPGEKRPVRRLPARPRRPADRRRQSQEEDQVLQLVRRPARRPGLRRVRAAEPVHLQERVPPARPQGQPAAS